MSGLHKGNRKALKRLRRRVYEEAYAFHYERTMRLALSGRLDKLKTSGFVVRRARRLTPASK